MKLGLGLIVKNESEDLPACLDSFLPHVDVACIIDTGSVDNTLEIAKLACERHKVTYSIHSFFDANDDNGLIENFSLARNEYVKRLENLAVDYIINCDADDTLLTPILRQEIEQSGADYVAINYRMDSGAVFHSYKIWKAKTKTRFVGKVHESANVDWSKKIYESKIMYQHKYSSPANQENGTARNLRILKKEIYPPLRSIFYYANECVDSKNYQEAVKWYLEYIRRCNEGEPNWFIELAHCYFRAARWLNYLGNQSEAIRLSKELLNKDPTWSESWCELAFTYIERGEYEAAIECAQAALKNEFKPRLFSEKDKYNETPHFLIAKAKFPNALKEM